MSCTLEIIIKVDFSIFFALILILHYANGSGIERKTGIAGERSNQKHAFFFFVFYQVIKRAYIWNQINVRNRELLNTNY